MIDLNYNKVSQNQLCMMSKEIYSLKHMSTLQIECGSKEHDFFVLDFLLVNVYTN